jgi:hypothetical protein
MSLTAEHWYAKDSVTIAERPPRIAALEHEIEGLSHGEEALIEAAFAQPRGGSSVVVGTPAGGPYAP